MADQKISELTQVSNLANADEFAVVDGSVTKRVTYGDLVSDLETTMDIESSADLNTRDTNNRNRSNHTGTQTASTISDFDTEVSNNSTVSGLVIDSHTHSNKAILDATTASFTTADETKLDGIETAATADQTDSEIVTAINNELGNTDWQTQISALTQEQVEDYVAALFQAGSHTNITVTYDDAAGSISLSGSGGGGGGGSLTQEEVEDYVGGLVASGTGVTVTYDDAGNALTISLSGESYTTAEQTKLSGIETGATANDTDANLKTRSNHTGTQTAATISDFDTEVSNNASVVANTAKISYTDAAKVATIETNADVTDTANVTAAGALMDSEVSSLSGIKTLTVPDSTTISTFGASLVDDADASTARTTLGVDSSGTDNSVEATTLEVNGGAITTKHVSPDSLAGSYAGTKGFQATVFDYGSSVATGDGKFYFRVPSSFNGMNLVSVHGEVKTAGTTGTTDIQIHNETDSVDMLSTKLTIDSGETGSDTAATAAVINGATDDVSTNDIIRIDVDAISTTAPEGLIITCEFRLP